MFHYRCFRSSHQKCSVKKSVFKKFGKGKQESTCTRVTDKLLESYDLLNTIDSVWQKQNIKT